MIINTWTWMWQFLFKFLNASQAGLNPSPPTLFGLDEDQIPVGCSRRREGMLKLSKWLFHYNRKMTVMKMVMMMMVPMMQTYTMDVIWWSNKVLTYYTFVLLLWTFRKENNKGFCAIIDPLNEQHIVIVEESHDWPNIF